MRTLHLSAPGKAHCMIIPNETQLRFIFGLMVVPEVRPVSGGMTGKMQNCQRCDILEITGSITVNKIGPDSAEDDFGNRVSYYRICLVKRAT